VVFLIGMRVNKPWKIWKWGPVASAMPKMLEELARQPDLGLLGSRLLPGFPVVTLIQYWRSFDALEAYAKSRTAQHLPAWKAFNTAVGSGGDVGIWHETFLVRAGEYETVYNNMPAFGLGAAALLVDAAGRRQSARARLRAG
jgi:hypothetical protein